MAEGREPTGALHVHRAERADALADALGEVLACPLSDPFAAEVVAVSAKGMERWLAQRLSHRLGTDGGQDGVCAHVCFPSPASVVAGAVHAALGLDPDADPWHPDRLVWPLLEVIDAAAGEPWCATLAAHLGIVAGTASDPARRARRFGTARRLAELFDSYAAHRPELLDAWLAGGDDDTPPDLRWQSEMWRRLRARLDVPGPAERLPAACAVLADEPGRAPLPSRLSVFGPTRLPAAHLAVLVALARHREVHLWLPHPSPALWRRTVPGVAGSGTAGLTGDRGASDDGGRGRGRLPRRRSGPTQEGDADVRHPLLASLGRDVHEMQTRLTAAAPGAVDHHHPAVEPPATLLGLLQRDLRADRVPAQPPVLCPGDRSITVHACHGAHRQVEVLREAVLGLLAADATLEPRDVLVMCPDIERFAPLVAAAFGSGSGGGAGDGDGGTGGPAHPGHRLQVRLADRALRQVNPLLDTVAHLLELADARLTASQVLDLAGSTPLRRRFRLGEDDLDRLRQLVTGAGVRWGLDAPHRDPFGLGRFPQNTWTAGLDRLLLGVAMDPHDWLGTALPLEVESGEVDRVGRLAELVERLGTVLGSLRGEQPLSAWIDALTTGLDILTDTSAADGWQAVQARAELAGVVVAAGPGAAAVPLGLADVRSVLARRLRGRPTRANFRTGTLTVATLVPMRAVPHRVVCLLGLDDGVFPRTGLPDGDDVLARDPLVGERDVRGEDRQLLLDAVCAATEHLVVLYSGADERTGARRPPAVPLGELLDALDATARTGDGRQVREQVVVRHPLQPFDARNFTTGALGVPGPFSFDRTELAGALAAAGPKQAPMPALVEPLTEPAPDGRPVALTDLLAFARHPARAFLRQRVGLSFADGPDEADGDALPVEPDGLRRWAIGDRLLRDRIAGLDLDRCREAEWRRGELPPGALGARLLTDVAAAVEPLVALSAEARAGVAETVDIDVVVAGGRRVVGTVGGVHDGVVVRVEYSRIAPKHRLRAWVELLAASAARPDRAWRAVVIARGAYSGAVRSTLGPVAPERATALLGDIVALHRRGLCEALPLATATSHAYAQGRRGGGSPGDARARAEQEWARDRDGRDDPAHKFLWGAGAPLAVLLEAPPQPDGPGALDEGTRFGALAMQLWEPLLSSETMEHR